MVIKIKYIILKIYLVYILFELLFNKIKIKNTSDNNNLIKINIVVSVPNHFNYFQRKVVEKIFQTQLFPKIKKIIIYQIIILNIIKIIIIKLNYIHLGNII